MWQIFFSAYTNIVMFIILNLLELSDDHYLKILDDLYIR